MGKGTIGLSAKPKKLKIYGDSTFYLRPIYMTEKDNKHYYYFALRPSKSSHYKIEGEFGVGSKSFKSEKADIKNGEYKFIKYVYYNEDLPDMSRVVRDNIIKWADCEIRDALNN